MPKSLPHNLIEIRRDWGGLSAYERFEAFVAAEAVLILALGITYWLMRERDDRLRLARRPGGGGRDHDRGASA